MLASQIYQIAEFKKDRDTISISYIILQYIPCFISILGLGTRKEKDTKNNIFNNYDMHATKKLNVRI